MIRIIAEEPPENGTQGLQQSWPVPEVRLQAYSGYLQRLQPEQKE